MAENIDIKELKTLFDLPLEKSKKDKDDRTSDVYGESPSSLESFDDKAEELSQLLDEGDFSSAKALDVKTENKIEIKDAVEEIYKVKVDAVNVMNVRGKKKKVRAREGMTASWKKAIVTLKPDNRIEVT